MNNPQKNLQKTEIWGWGAGVGELGLGSWGAGEYSRSWRLEGGDGSVEVRSWGVKGNWSCGAGDGSRELGSKSLYHGTYAISLALVLSRPVALGYLTDGFMFQSIAATGGMNKISEGT